MARLTRIKFDDPHEGYYHIISRTVLKSFLLGEIEKEIFFRIMKKLSRVYFVRVPTFSIMSNHFHLIVQMIPSDEISEKELKKRFEIYYNEGVSKKYQRSFDISKATRLRERFADISCFVQDLKQRFSRWYNKQNNGNGHIWSDRFKSVLLEEGRALLACMIYVDLNSVRAGIVDKPEDYRYSGLYQMLSGGRSGKWLDKEILISTILWEMGVENNKKEQISYKSILKYYQLLVYKSGMIEKEGKAHILDKNAELVLKNELNTTLFLHKIRYFTDGVMLGSQAFCNAKYHKFRNYFKTKKERTGNLIFSSKKPSKDEKRDNLLKLYSIRNFSSGG